MRKVCTAYEAGTQTRRMEYQCVLACSAATRARYAWEECIERDRVARVAHLTVPDSCAGWKKEYDAAIATEMATAAECADLTAAVWKSEWPWDYPSPNDDDLSRCDRIPRLREDWARGLTQCVVRQIWRRLDEAPKKE